jgi:CBS domain-containing protein
MPAATIPFAEAVVGDAMHPGIVTCGVDATVTEVAAAMAGAHIHCVVIAGVSRRNGGEHLTWGVLSDLDLMAALAADDTATAASLAATATVTVESNEPLSEAARIMSENQVAHLVVVDSGSDRPVGVISTLDVARAAA